MIAEHKSTLLDAKELVSLDWHVLPLYHPLPDGTCSCSNPVCTSPGKHPLTKNGVHDATTDNAQIERWIADYLDANLGVALGKISGLVVVEDDPRHGGDLNLTELERQHEALPPTVTAISGGGGRHRYFGYPGFNVNSVNQLANGVEVRSDGLFVVVTGRIVSG